ncbi:MAG TPA: enoyl-CoA hydratase-related protein [Cytophagaceae bacterium]
MALVNYSVIDRIATISINRPDKKNALNFEVVSELKNAFDQAEKDASVKVVILTGEGDVFCAGADLEYLQTLQKNSYEENLKDSTHLMELYKKIYTLKKVVIAKINGHAIAGGCGLAAVCDFSFSTINANFGYTEVRIGFIPAIVMVFLLRKVGEANAKELLLSGKIIKAQEAQNLRLINYITEAEELDATVQAFAESLCKNNSGISMEITKRMIAEIGSMSLDEGLAYAAAQNAEARSSADCQRGIAAFLNKEKITW